MAFRLPSILAKITGYDAVNKRGDGRVAVPVETKDEDGILPSPKRSQLIATQRDSFRNTTFSPATGLQLQINVIGSEGGRVSFTTDDNDFNQRAGVAFRKWARHFNFTDGASINETLQLLLLQLTHNGGDFLAVFDDGCLTGGRGSGKVRIFESDEIKNVTKAEFLRLYGANSGYSQNNGIVMDRYGRVAGAFVSTLGRNEEEFQPGTYLHLKLREPADFTGSNWVLVRKTWRVNQRRGISTASHVTNLLQDLADTQASEVQAAKLNSGFGLVVKDSGAEAVGVSDSSKGWEDNTTTEGIELSEETRAELEALEAAENAAIKEVSNNLKSGQSAILKLSGDKSVDSFKTERPNLNTVAFITDLRIEAGTVYGLPSCYTTLKPEGSYTSARASMVLAERAFNQLRKKLERDFLDWLAIRFIEWAGFDAPEDFELCIRWRWPSMLEVDEGAAQTAVQKEYLNAVRNLDPLTEDAFIRERARQTEKFHKAGLTAPWEVSLAGAQLTTETAKDVGTDNSNKEDA